MEQEKRNEDDDDVSDPSSASRNDVSIEMSFAEWNHHNEKLLGY